MIDQLIHSAPVILIFVVVLVCLVLADRIDRKNPEWRNKKW
jgi:hypothetical protein